MAESGPIDTRDPSDNLLELQPFQNLGLGDTIDPSENPLELQPFQNLGLGQLDTVRALIGGGNVQVRLHQHTAHNIPVVKGDVVQGLKTDVKASAMETLTLPTGDSSLQGHFQQQALPEPLIQDALPWADGEELKTEDSDRLEDVFQDEVVNAFGKIVDFKKFARSRRGLCLDEIDIENIVEENRAVHDQKIQIMMKWKEKNGKSATSSNIRYLVKKFKDSDSQKGPQQRAQHLSEQQSQSQDQRESFLTMEEQVETLNANSPTKRAITTDGLAVAPISAESALEMIKLYKNEKNTQDVGDFLPLLETTWKFIQAKILLKSFENQLVHGRGLQSAEHNLSTFISRVYDVYKIAEQFVSENNFIHAVILFYAAANLHRISDKSISSVFGIRNCIRQVTLVVQKMTWSEPGVKNIVWLMFAKMTNHTGMNDLVIDHVIPLMNEMKDYIQSIQSSSCDTKVESEAQCLHSIAKCYSYCGEYQQYANMNEYAVQLMKKHFNDEAATYCVYGNCLNNAGVAYKKLGEKEKSREKYKMSLKAYEEVNNWPDEKYKTDSIARTKNNLRFA